MLKDYIAAMAKVAQMQAVNLTDQQALDVKCLFPEWKPGENVKAGERRQYEGLLYKVREGQGHHTQEGWEPQIATALWEAIDETHTGTEKDPIPYRPGMALEAGKHYTQHEALYRCTRDTQNPVYDMLKDLIGIYVEEII